MDETRRVDNYVGRLCRDWRFVYTAGKIPLTVDTRVMNLIIRLRNKITGTNHPTLYEIIEWEPGENFLYVIVRRSDGSTFKRDVRRVGKIHRVRRAYAQAYER